MTNLGRVLKAWRWKEEFSLREFADELGLHHLTLRRIENGLPVSSVQVARVLCWMLDRDSMANTFISAGTGKVSER